MDRVRIAVVGTGGIGRLHAELAAGMPAVDLVAVSGLDDEAGNLADRLGVPLVRDYRRVLDLDVEAVVVAVPNQLHREIGSWFITNGVTVLMEKPIADTVADGVALCQAAEDHGVGLLVGQHRRHNNLVKTAAKVVRTRLGRPVATNTMITMRKPDSYYEPEWRRAAGAGPLLVNLIHEVDLLRAVWDEIVAVQASSARLGRSFDFDDTATIIVHFADGSMGTMVISESTPSPWSWEASVSEGMGFHNAGQDNARFVGTEGSLGFPSLTLWTYDATDGEPGWYAPLHAQRVGVVANNPYVDQLSNLVEVARGTGEPVVCGRDGLRSLAVVEAVVEAARSGNRIEIDAILNQPPSP